MPLDDAVSLIRRNFDTYLLELRRGGPAAGGAANPAPAAVSLPPHHEFKAPDPKVTYLLNLLADHRFLTLDELDVVNVYLQQRRVAAEATGQGKTAGEGEGRGGERGEGG